MCTMPFMETEVFTNLIVYRYIKLDPDLPSVLLDMKESGKSLLLITNSDWPYTSTMMEFAYDRYSFAPSACAQSCVGAASMVDAQSR